MIYLEAEDDFNTDIIQTPHTGTCRWDDFLFLAQEYKFMNLDRIVTIVWFSYLTINVAYVSGQIGFLDTIGDFIFCRSVTSRDNRVSTRTLLLLLLWRSHTDTEHHKIRDSSVAFAAAATGGRGSMVCRSVGSLIPGMIRV